MERKDYLKEDLTKEEINYIEKIVISTVYKYLKRNQNHINVVVEELNDNIVDDSFSILDIVMEKCREEIKSAMDFEKEFLNSDLYEAFKALSLKERIVLFLHYKKNKSFREIASDQKIDKNTVKNRKNSALNKLKRILEDEENV